MVIYQHHNKSAWTKGITKAYELEDLDYYEKLFKDYVNSDLALKVKVKIGMSFCAENDNYSRKLGRILSASRLKEEMVDIGHVRVCEKFVTFHLYSRQNDFSFKLRFLKTFKGSPRIY